MSPTIAIYTLFWDASLYLSYLQPNLYLSSSPTDYVSGGELFTHLYQREKFREEEVRIYVAEIVLAIETLHKVSCELPDNYSAQS